MVYCADCGKELSRGGVYRCWECHVKNLKKRALERKFECPECKKTTKHYGKGMCRSCYMKAYNSRPEYKKHHAQKERENRKEYPERYRNYDRKRQKTQRRIEWQKKYRPKYYAENREELIAYQRAWRADKKNRPAQNIFMARYRNRVRNLPATLTLDDWNRILEENNHSCYYCGRNDLPLVKEHKIPASRGGGYTPDNIVPACGICNSSKGTKTDQEFREYLIQKNSLLI